MRVLYNMAAALLALLAERVTVLRTGPVVKCIVGEFTKRPHAKVMGGVCTAGIAILAVCFAAFMGAMLFDVGALLMAPFTLALPEHLAKKHADYTAIAEELEAKQTEYSGKPMPASVASDLDGKVKQADDLWREIEPELKRYQKLAKIGEQKRLVDQVGREVEEPTIPAGQQPGEGKAERKKNRPVAYVSLGAAVAASEGYKQFLDAGMPKTYMQLFDGVQGAVITKGGREIYIPLTKDQLEKFEAKAVPTVGADVIEVDRIAEVVRTTEQERLTLRDLLNVSQTNSDSVSYIKITSVTRAAAAVAEGSAKPEATMALDTVTESVRTQAVWMPVHNNQLSDVPQLRNIIDVELLYDLGRYEEEQILYGAGTGEEFEGVVVNTDVQAARTVTGDTLIDVIRRMATDIRRDGYEPNGVAIDPLDWEEIELEKGTDNRYVWAVIRDALGPRIWSMRVVETTAAEANEGNATERRNVVVGDWQRGATLWVRQSPAVAVGWINDQFTKNQRTLLAEQRAAFGTKRPNAFRKHETQASAT